MGYIALYKITAIFSQTQKKKFGVMLLCCFIHDLYGHLASTHTIMAFSRDLRLHYTGFSSFHWPSDKEVPLFSMQWYMDSQ